MMSFQRVEYLHNDAANRQQRADTFKHFKMFECTLVVISFGDAANGFRVRCEYGVELSENMTYAILMG